MIKLEYVKTSPDRGPYFSFRSEEFYDCSAVKITLFGKTFRIKYSKKFNYFLIAYKTIQQEKDLARQRFLTGSLAQVVLEQALAKEGISVSDMEFLPVEGKSPTFVFKALYEDKPCFIKLHIHATPPSKKSIISQLRKEYENGLLFSECPYCLSPIIYLEFQKFEILVTPLIQNTITLHDYTRKKGNIPEKYLLQLQETRNYMKINNLAHGDLHGINILIGNVYNEEHQLYIIDFSHAKKFNSEEYLKSQEYKSDEINFNRFLKNI